MSGASIMTSKATSRVTPNVISYIYCESYFLCARCCIENMK